MTKGLVWSGTPGEASEWEDVGSGSGGGTKLEVFKVPFAYSTPNLDLGVPTGVSLAVGDVLGRGTSFAIEIPWAITNAGADAIVSLCRAGDNPSTALVQFQVTGVPASNSGNGVTALSGISQQAYLANEAFPLTLFVVLVGGGKPTSTAGQVTLYLE